MVVEYTKLGRIGVVFQSGHNPIFIPRDDFIPSAQIIKEAPTLCGLFVKDPISRWIMEERAWLIFFRSMEELGQIVRSDRMIEVDKKLTEQYYEIGRASCRERV